MAGLFVVVELTMAISGFGDRARPFKLGRSVVSRAALSAWRSARFHGPLCEVLARWVVLFQVLTAAPLPLPTGPVVLLRAALRRTAALSE